eukprot:1073-Heterococcus_DN1.PRE.1
MRGGSRAQQVIHAAITTPLSILHHEDAITGLDSLFAPGACAFAAAGEGLLALIVAVAPVDLLAVALGFAAAGLVLGLTGAALLTAAVALPTACNNAT